MNKKQENNQFIYKIDRFYYLQKENTIKVET